MSTSLLLFKKIGLKGNQLKLIMAQDACDTILRKSHVCVGNPYLYLQSLNQFLDTRCSYEYRNTMMVSDSKEIIFLMERELCNHETLWL